MGGALSLIRETALLRWKSLMLWGIGAAVLYQLVLMAALILRFGKLPNYWVGYDWPANVARIIEKTPAISDMWPIIKEEWILEIGFMNYDYGLGLSEWALTVLPWKLAVLFGMGALVGLSVNLLRSGSCSTEVSRTGGSAATLGAGLVLFTNATMSWVVCCATPSWVVGLAMLGLGVSTSLAVEGLGLWLSMGGFVLLLASVFAIAWSRSRANIIPLASGEAHHA